MEALTQPGMRGLGGDRPGCTLAGPGRGDCAHFVGLPGRSIPGQHDGPDDTVDHYGKPNGWCWSCWKDRQIEDLQAMLAAAPSTPEKGEKDDAGGVTACGEGQPE